MNWTENGILAIALHAKRKKEKLIKPPKLITPHTPPYER
jgi:hypothetical protein